MREYTGEPVVYKSQSEESHCWTNCGRIGYRLRHFSLLFYVRHNHGFIYRAVRGSTGDCSWEKLYVYDGLVIDVLIQCRLTLLVERCVKFTTFLSPEYANATV